MVIVSTFFGTTELSELDCIGYSELNNIPSCCIARVRTAPTSLRAHPRRIEQSLSEYRSRTDMTKTNRLRRGSVRGRRVFRNTARHLCLLPFAHAGRQPSFVDQGDGTVKTPKPLTVGARTNEIPLAARRVATSLACKKIKKSAEPLEVTVLDAVGTAWCVGRHPNRSSQLSN